MTDSTVEAVARAAHPVWRELVKRLSGHMPRDHHLVKLLIKVRESDIDDTLTALGWLPPEAQVNIERTALARARVICRKHMDMVGYSPDSEAKNFDLVSRVYGSAALNISIEIAAIAAPSPP